MRGKVERTRLSGKVERTHLSGKEEIGERVDNILKGYKVGTYVTVQLRDDGFDYCVNEQALADDVAQRSGSDAAPSAKRLERVKKE